MRKLAFSIVVFVALYNVMLAIESEWECASAHQLFQNLLKASRDQGKAHLITDSQTKDLFTDIEASISDTDNAKWVELLKAIKELIDMRKQVASNTIEAIRIVTEASITNDIDALETLDKYLKDFENSNRLAKACSLVQLAQNLTDVYVEKMHLHYVRFTDGVVPNLEIIKNALDKLTDDDAATETADWDMQLEATTQNIRSITTQIGTNLNEQMGDFKDEIEKLALEIDIKYKEINLDLNALRQNEEH